MIKSEPIKQWAEVANLVKAEVEHLDFCFKVLPQMCSLNDGKVRCRSTELDSPLATARNLYGEYTCLAKLLWFWRHIILGHISEFIQDPNLVLDSFDRH